MTRKDIMAAVIEQIANPLKSRSEDGIPTRTSNSILQNLLGTPRQESDDDISKNDAEKGSFEDLSQKYNDAPMFPAVMNAPWVPEWPAESVKWSTREVELYSASGGVFHPDEMAEHRRVPKSDRRQAEVEGLPGRVSVVCPTMEFRQMFHEQLWKVFDSLTWEDKELVVVETFCDSPSPFLSAKAEEDERLVYVAFQLPQTGEEPSIGLKRNLCTHLASGEILVNFDDDDIYAPTYVTKMVEGLRGSKALAATLSSWYVYDTGRKQIGFTDPEAMPWQDMIAQWGWPEDFCEGRKDSWLYGYGFSFVFYRQIAIENPFLDMNMGEDYKFLCKLRNISDGHVKLIYDHSGMVLHTMHPKASSTCYVARQVHKHELMNMDIGRHALLLNEYFASWSAIHS